MIIHVLLLALALATEARGAEAPLIHEGVIEAPVEAVWEAFTTKQGLESWMVAHAEIDLKVGGLMRTHYRPDGKIGDPDTIENTILSFDPQRMLSIKATKAPQSFPFPTALERMWTVIYFEPLGNGRTRLTVRGLGFGADEESRKMRAFFEQGNRLTIEKLQKRFAPPEKAATPEMP